jgi:hypothetical protein
VGHLSHADAEDGLYFPLGQSVQLEEPASAYLLVGQLLQVAD